MQVWTARRRVAASARHALAVLVLALAATLGLALAHPQAAGASAGSLSGPVGGGSWRSFMPKVGVNGNVVAYATALRNFDASASVNPLRIGVYLRDRTTGAAVKNVNVVRPVGGGMPDGDSYPLAVSPDVGTRYILYSSAASNLVVGDTNGKQDVFLFDRVTGTTERVSVSGSGAQGNGDVSRAAMTPDARYVAFVSASSNVVAGDVNGEADVFLRDRVAGTTTLVSQASGVAGAPTNGDSLEVSVSDNGRYVAFSSFASNLVVGDANAAPDVFLRDRTVSTTERVSVGFLGEGGGGSTAPQISADGRFVAFDSAADDLVPNDDNLSYDVFVRDRTTSSTERVSVGPNGEQGADDSTDPSMSRDGRYIAFESDAEEFSATDGNISSDVYVRDRVARNTVRASEKANNLDAFADADDAAISPEGRFVAFDTDSEEYNESGDTNGDYDVYIKDLSNFYTALPAANAGPDVTVGLAATVMLDASDSFDPEGLSLTYQWQQIGGPPAVIDDKSKSRPQVSTPSGPTTLTFRVTVTNSSGKSATDDVIMTVKAPK